MIFSVTEITTFKRCPRQWYFSSFNQLALERIVKKPALSLGLCIHEALAGWREQPDANPVELYLIATDKSITKAREVYLKANNTAMSPAEEDTLYQDVMLGTAMMNNYVNYWKSPLPPNYKLVGSEQEVLVDIPGTEHKLQGRLDAIIQDQHGRLFDLDNKTYNTHPRRDTLQSSEQFIAYTWILRQLEMGEVAGVAYDGLWKRAKPPTGKTLDDLFTRERIIPSLHQIEEYALYLPGIVNAMAACKQFYPVRDPMGSCNWLCGYESLCTAWSRGEDWRFHAKGEYTKRERHETELGAYVS